MWVAAVVAFLVVVSWLGVIDRASADYVDGAIVQASVAFAVARVLNAIISVLQSVTANVFVAEVGFGEALDPMNDLIEQFSSLMQMALGSLILQKILIVIVADVYFKVALTVTGAVLIISTFFRSIGAVNILLKTFAFMVFLRFSVVVIVLLNSVVYDAFLADQVRREVAVLDGLPATIDVMNQGDTAPVDLSELQNTITEEFEAQRQTRAKDRADIEAELSSLEATLAVQQAELQNLEAQMDAVSRLNFLNRSDEHASAKQQIGITTAQVDEVKSRLKANDRLMRNLEREKTAMAEARDGKPGFWNGVGESLSSIGGKFAKLADMDTYKHVLHTLDNMVYTIVTVMILFILKTLILPLLFLFGFIKVFKAIWGLDLREMLRKPSLETPVNGTAQNRNAAVSNG